MANSPSPTGITEIGRKKQARKVALAAFVGTTIEWYDFFIYAACAALIFGPQFFPTANPLASQLAAFSTFAVAFLARPLGGVLAGHFGDRYGRKRVLVLTMTGMGVATLGVGALPTYAQIGVAAPVLLVALRVVQGLAVGGEYGGAVSMTVESAPAGRRAFYSVAVTLGAPAGLILSNGGLLALSAGLGPNFAVWGWRVAFLSSFVLIVVGMVIRRSVSESPEFARTSTHPVRVPLAALFRSHPKILLTMVVLAGVPTILNYIILSYALAYGTRTIGYTSNQMLLFVVITCLVALAVYPLIGLATDAVGPRRVLAISAATQVVGGFLFFAGFDSSNFALALVAGSVAILTSGSAFVALPAALAAAFPTEIRYTGISTAYQTGAGIFGGLSPIVATLLYAETGSTAAISIYVAAAAVLMLIATWATPRRAVAPASQPKADVAVS